MPDAPRKPAGSAPSVSRAASAPTTARAAPAAKPAVKPAVAVPPGQRPAQAGAGKPAPPPSSRAAPAKPIEPTRREFFALAAGWSAFTLACATGAAAAQRFMYPNVLFEPPQQFKAGFPDSYGVGQVETRFTNKYGVWVVRDETGIFALISVCTHLGCTPNWLATEGKFKCPCHGSGFYPNGINFEGPAPRPLERAAVSLAEDGQVLVDKSKKFRYELGEWEKPGAVLKV